MAEPGVYTYQYPRPAVTTDAVVFVLGETGLDVLLVERGRAPFAGTMALPGGFVDPDEPLETAARRELLEETGVTAGTMIQVGAFGDPGRDPRGHTVGVGFLTLMRREEVARTMTAADDAAAVALAPVGAPPLLAFDHGEILAAALVLLRGHASCRALLLDLLEESFTLDELQAAVEAVRGAPLARRTLEERVAAARGLVASSDGRIERVAGADDRALDLTA